MPEWLRSVRVRITLVATVVTGVAVVVAGLWLVRTVEGSLTDNVESATAERITAVRRALEEGRLPTQEELAALGEDAVLQVTGPNGNVIVSSRTPGGAPLVVGSTRAAEAGGYGS
ncbi:MAG: hypothetical protein M3Z03_05110, partial [Actinomycetota bacterium]|nr:hypothetical protein [Actinomycetota bacterium]